MIAIVCGGRDYTDRNRVRQVLDAAVVKLGLRCIIQGNATGADALAAEWAISRPDISMITCPANWDAGKSAGAIRNKFMLDILLGGEEARAVFVFPGGRGTKNMADLANSRAARDKNVRVINVT